MTQPGRFTKQRIAGDLERVVEEANRLARKLGLDPFPVNYWVVDYDEMHELMAYGGFQRRYPHWRWGMQYDRHRKRGQYGMGKAFEIVNNDDPANAFLQESNTTADQKAVITHVEAHSDFFANNEWYGMFDDGVGAAQMLERHADAIEEYMSDPSIDRDEVERWIDHALALEDNIDQYRSFGADRYEFDEYDAGDDIDEDVADQLGELDISEEVREQVFDDEWVDGQGEDAPARSYPEKPEKDLLGFLRAHGKRYDDDAGKAVEMADWQRDVLEMLRAEAYYFAPQKMTKILNEGWACVAPETPVFTDDGVLPMEAVVDDHTTVSDGDAPREVYDSNVIPDHDTVTVETRRGFEVTGSNNHRVRRPDGSWVRLDELEPGDEIEVSGGDGLWADDYAAIDWSPPEYTSLGDVADEAGVSVWTVMRYRDVGRAERAEAIEAALEAYDGANRGVAERDPIRVPDEVTEAFGRLLGLLVGDGHVSTAAGHVGFTAARRERAEEFAGLATELFGVDPSVEEQGSRWRTYIYSGHLVEMLTEAPSLDLPDGDASDEKTVPEAVLRSPRSVVAEFLRGLFDADGYAGGQGAILSTSSEEMSEQVQLLLANFGMLTRRREQNDGCYHVHLTGASAREFAEEIGFGYDEKADSLWAYLDDLAWFETESWTDEVVSTEEGTGTVYDISVEETHRYAAAGLINHNSYWESKMMADEGFAEADEFMTYADHMAKVLGSPGLNPYKLGLELWEYVENTTNREAVVEKLLRVEGITWRNFSEAVDADDVLETLSPPEAIAAPTNETLDALDAVDDRYLDRENIERARDGEVDVDRYPWKVLSYEGLAWRHFSLLRPQFRGFLGSISKSELERVGRYMFENDRYDSVEEALADVDYRAGWRRMFEIRESHNDVTFLDEFLTQEFVDDNEYFTYEYSQAAGQFRVASTDYEDVKRKLLLQFTNFGKPTITVRDGNYRNRNELLLAHHYNGVMLDVEQAKRTLERVFELWGRPVNLVTVVKQVDEHDVEVAKRRDKEPEPEEAGLRVRYDGDRVEMDELDWERVEELGIVADDVDYDTKPDEWLA